MVWIVLIVMKLEDKGFFFPPYYFIIIHKHVYIKTHFITEFNKNVQTGSAWRTVSSYRYKSLIISLLPTLTRDAGIRSEGSWPLTRVRRRQAASDDFQVSALAGLERRATACATQWCNDGALTLVQLQLVPAGCYWRASELKQKHLYRALSPACPCQREAESAGKLVFIALCPAVSRSSYLVGHAG